MGANFIVDVVLVVLVDGHGVDCGSSLYTELEVMSDATVIKAGGLDDKNLRDLKGVDVEFYCEFGLFIFCLLCNSVSPVCYWCP